MKIRMKAVHIVYFFAFSILIFSNSCKKDNTSATPVFNSAKQATIDDSLLINYFKENNLSDSVTKTASGLYYRITKPMPDSLPITNGRTVFVRYNLNFLDNTLVESNVDAAVAFQFIPGSSSVITAWQEGIPLFKKGEEGYIYSPSRLAYKNVVQSRIPANSNLKFFIRIANVEK